MVAQSDDDGVVETRSPPGIWTSTWIVLVGDVFGHAIEIGAAPAIADSHVRPPNRSAWCFAAVGRYIARLRVCMAAPCTTCPGFVSITNRGRTLGGRLGAPAPPVGCHRQADGTQHR
jgi:hypothetical protein